MTEKPLSLPVVVDPARERGGGRAATSSTEEQKMEPEMRKMLHAPGLLVHATAVRVPMLVGHSVSLALRLRRVARAAGFSGPRGALADMFERTLPKPRRHEVSGPGGTPLAIRRVPDSANPAEADAMADVMAAVEAASATDEQE